MKKKLLFATTVAAALVLGSQSALADVAVCYYEFDSNVRWTSYSNSSFSVTRGSLTIVGWQTNDNLNITPSATYQVVKKGFLSDTTYGTPVTVDGRFPKDGSWFTRYAYNVPADSGYHLRIVMNSGYSTRGTGNGY